MADRVSNLAAALSERVVPGGLARERVLDVVAPLVPLLPSGGLRRGSTVAVVGGAAMSLALALAAGPSAQGAWVGVVGVPSVGLAAAAEAGLALERLFLVAAPPARQWAEVVAAAAEGAEVVIVGIPEQLRAGEARRVQARLQVRGGVLISVGSSPGLGAELELTAEPLGWEGIGDGHGRLVARRVEVVLGGRRAGRPVRRELWLPGPDGRVAETEAVVAPLAGPAQHRVAG